jgi:hypothetical protein
MRGAALLLLALLGGAAAHASVTVTSGAFSGARLAVDSKGLAEVSWVQSGSKQVLFVPPTGEVFHGGSLSGRDVSRPDGLALPMTLTVRRTADGSRWALQRWQRPGRPDELHLAHWRGAPTKLTLSVSANAIQGRATFAGQPVAVYSSTPAGKRQRVYIYLDCFGCGRPGWTQMIGVAPVRGAFKVRMRPSWKGSRYRAELAGPNTGATRAPDAVTIVPA